MDSLEFLATLVGQDVLVVRRVGRSIGGRLVRVEGDPANPTVVVNAGGQEWSEPWDNIHRLKPLLPKDLIA